MDMRTFMKRSRPWIAALLLGQGCLLCISVTGCHGSQQTGPDVDSVFYEITDSDRGTWRDMEREAFGDSPSTDTPEKAELRRQFRKKHPISIK